MIETKVRAFRKKKCPVWSTKSKVVDHKMVCNLIFCILTKVPVWPEKTGKDPVDVHDIAMSGMYNIDRFRDEKRIRQDPGRAPVTKAQTDTLLSYGATWWVRDDLERERDIRYHSADRQSAGDDIQTGRYTSTATARGDLQAMGGAGNPIGIILVGWCQQPSICVDNRTVNHAGRN